MGTDLIITRVEATPIQLHRLKPFRGALSERTTGEQVIVRIGVADDADLTGLGECSFVQRGFHIHGEDQNTVVSTIRRILGPAIRGMSAFDLEKIHQRMGQAVGGAPYAKGAIDVALHDLVGRALGVPVHTLLGGLCRDRMPIVLSIATQAPEAMAADAVRMIERGYRRVTLKIGSDVRQDLKRIAAVREAAGEEVEIEIDANQGYLVDDAIRIARASERFGITLFEQPVAWWNLAGMAEVRRAGGIPIAADESAWTPQHVLEIVERRAADIIVLKYQKNGGLFRSRKMAAIIEAAGLKINVGSLHPTSIGTAAVHHLAASAPNFDGGVYGGPLGVFTEDIATEPISAVDGIVHVQSLPGLGVRLNEAQVAKYAVPVEREQ